MLLVGVICWAGLGLARCAAHVYRLPWRTLKDGNGDVSVGYRRNVLFPATENLSRPHPH